MGSYPLLPLPRAGGASPSAAQTKLNAKQRGMLAERYAKGETMAALAREFDVSEPTVRRALRSSPGESRGAE